MGRFVMFGMEKSFLFMPCLFIFICRKIGFETIDFIIIINIIII